MNRKSPTAAGALLCAAALVLPAGASAASFDTGVREVKRHTTRAGGALDRAQVLFERRRDGAAALAFAQSRRELGSAKRGTARLLRRAASEPERIAAARAQALVAGQQDRNVEQLVGLLDKADGRVEGQIAQAALADTRGRDKAISVITAIIGSGVADEAIPGLTRALAALSQGRDGEIRVEAQAIASDELSSWAQRVVGKTVEEAVSGQATSAAKLAELIAAGRVPTESAQGLVRAYAAATGEQERSAEILGEFSGRMPAPVRLFVEQVVQQARENAQGMRDGWQSLAASGPEGASGWTPTGTPSGAVGDTSGWAPTGTPSGAVGDTPSHPAGV